MMVPYDCVNAPW